MRQLLQDVRYAVRLLMRSPGFTVVAVAALAIGIGANTAIFSVVNTLLIERLPYQDADRLAVIWEHNLPRDRKNNVVSPGNFIHWREMQQSFVDLAAVGGMTGLNFRATLTGRGEPEELPVQYVSASFFPLLGVAPAHGRVFTAEEDRPQSQVAVISDSLWKRRFDGDPGILQTPVTLDERPYTVVGVMPRGFSYLDRSTDVWLPIGFPAEARTPRGRWMTALGRLKPGVTFEQAQADMERVHAELTRRFPDFNTGWTARVVPLREQLTGDVRPALLFMLGAVAFVLLIACANVANLLLARATARRRELAVRAALGAGRGRIVRQLLAESVVLATAGGVAGLLLAYWGLHVLRGGLADELPVQRLEAVAIDGRVLAFTAAAALLSGLFFGIVPAFSASSGVPADALREGGRGGSAGAGRRARSAFVIVEVALALVLLVGAGLLLRSFMRVLDVDPGFDPARTVTMRVSLPSARYADAAARSAFFERTFEAIDRLPGLEASGATSFLPMAGLGSATRFEVAGAPGPAPGEEPVCDVRVVANDYFRAIGVPLLRGRLFREGGADLAGRIIINETMARQHWPGENPIGKRVRISWGENPEDEVIGVVGDVHNIDLETEPRPTIYWPYPRVEYGTMSIALRTRGDATAIVNSAVRAIRELDPQLAVADIRTLDDVVASSVAERRLTVALIGIFAAAALLLAAVGIYGVIACSVTQRTREIGIRMALGAPRASVLRMVVGQAMALAAAGIAAGSLLAVGLTRMMEELLFGVTPGDPLTFAAVAGMLAIVAALASFVPGRRATRVDPLDALRSE